MPPILMASFGFFPQVRRHDGVVPLNLQMLFEASLDSCPITAQPPSMVIFIYLFILPNPSSVRLLRPDELYKNIGVDLPPA
jgi:hypothetical protein